MDETTTPPPPTPPAAPADTASQELLQGEALQADQAAKKKLAQESAARVDAVLQAEFAAMEGINPGLRGDYQWLRGLLAHAMTKH